MVKRRAVGKRGEVKRKCPHQARQVQVVHVLDKEWGLSAKQIARRLNVSIKSVYSYLGILLKHNIVIVNFRERDGNAKKPTNYYALKQGE